MIVKNSAIILISPDEKTLLLKNTYGSLGWSTPGGRIDPGESGFTSAIRELYEETKIKLSLYDIEDIQKFIYKDTEIFVIRIFVKASMFKIRLSFEHSSYRWVHLEKIYEYPLEDYARKSFKKAENLGLLELAF